MQSRRRPDEDMPVPALTHGLQRHPAVERLIRPVGDDDFRIHRLRLARALVPPPIIAVPGTKADKDRNRPDMLVRADGFAKEVPVVVNHHRDGDLKWGRFLRHCFGVLRV